MTTLPETAHPELVAFHAKASAPSIVDKAAVHAQIVPSYDISAKALAQVQEFRHALTLAELAPHDHALDGQFEHLHQTLDRIEADAKASTQALRALAADFTQWERYVEQLPDRITAILDP